MWSYMGDRKQCCDQSRSALSLLGVEDVAEVNLGIFSLSVRRRDTGSAEGLAPWPV